MIWIIVLAVLAAIFVVLKVRSTKKSSAVQQYLSSHGGFGVQFGSLITEIERQFGDLRVYRSEFDKVVFTNKLVGGEVARATLTVALKAEGGLHVKYDQEEYRAMGFAYTKPIGLNWDFGGEESVEEIVCTVRADVLNARLEALE